VEARRSRVPRSGIASDAEGALDLGGTAPQAAQRPRTHPRKRHKSLVIAKTRGHDIYQQSTETAVPESADLGPNHGSAPVKPSDFTPPTLDSCD
jgi:hypothetical protein